MVELKDLNTADMICLCILSGHEHPTQICKKLNHLGFPVGENTVRARISELKTSGVLYREGENYGLSEAGGAHLAKLTKQLTDEQIESFD